MEYCITPILIASRVCIEQTAGEYTCHLHNKDMCHGLPQAFFPCRTHQLTTQTHASLRLPLNIMAYLAYYWKDQHRHRHPERCPSESFHRTARRKAVAWASSQVGSNSRQHHQGPQGWYWRPLHPGHGHLKKWSDTCFIGSSHMTRTRDGAAS